MLLRQVIALDTSRDEFVIQQLEAPIELAIDQVRLRLRIDRIDRLENGEVVIDGMVVVDDPVVMGKKPGDDGRPAG